MAHVTRVITTLTQNVKKKKKKKKQKGKDQDYHGHFNEILAYASIYQLVE